MIAQTGPADGPRQAAHTTVELASLEDPFGELVVLRADTSTMSASDRHMLAESLRADATPGTILLATCHRVELSGERSAMAPVILGQSTAGIKLAEGGAAAQHFMRVAVGLDSAVVGEDQILHQLRTAVGTARAVGGLPPLIDRLADTALRIGRQARSWLPPNRPSLADIALDLVTTGADAGDRTVLVVGAGAMGNLAARAVRSRRWSLLVSSQTPERAMTVARRWQGRQVPFDPGLTARDVSGIVIALSGRWPLSAHTADVISDGVDWVVDLSSPPALDPALAQRLSTRLRTIDDLALERGVGDSQLHRHLEEVVQAGLDDLLGWVAAAADRDGAQALAVLAADARSSELAALWGELGEDLYPEQQAAIERMAKRLTSRILRSPLERLGQDRDGHYGRAARDLFRL